jgi:hypothetical protein
MPQDIDFNVATFKPNLDSVYHDRLTDLVPAGLDLYSHAAEPIGQSPRRPAQAHRTDRDPLDVAVQSTQSPAPQRRGDAGGGAASGPAGASSGAVTDRRDSDPPGATMSDCTDVSLTPPRV